MQELYSDHGMESYSILPQSNLHPDFQSAETETQNVVRTMQQFSFFNVEFARALTQLKLAILEVSVTDNTILAHQLFIKENNQPWEENPISTQDLLDSAPDKILEIYSPSLASIPSQ